MSSTSSPARITYPIRILFLTTAEGGRFTHPRSGVRPHLLLPDGNVTSVCVTRSDEGAWFILGEETDADLELFVPELYARQMSQLVSVELYEGRKLVGRGHVRDAR